MQKSVIIYGNVEPLDLRNYDIEIPVKKIVEDPEEKVCKDSTTELTPQKVAKIYSDTIDRVLEFENDPSSNYKSVLNTEDIKVYRKTIKSNIGVCLIKAKIRIKGLSAQESFKM